MRTSKILRAGLQLEPLTDFNNMGRLPVVVLRLCGPAQDRKTDATGSRKRRRAVGEMHYCIHRRQQRVDAVR